MSFEDRIGVSESVTRLGSINGAGHVDGAAQHCACEQRRQGVRRIMLPAHQGSERIEGRPRPAHGLTHRQATDLTRNQLIRKNSEGGHPIR